MRDCPTIATPAWLVLRSDRIYRFVVGPERVWAAISDTDSYQRWWPWLRSFAATGLRVGDRWDCVVQSPLPYQLRATVTLTGVDAPSRVSASISGDIGGAATIYICADGAGSQVRLVSHLAARSHLVRAASMAAWPLARLGHDWVLDTAAQQFAAHATDTPTLRAAPGEPRR